MTSEFVLQQIISGIAIGMAYALIAIGYSIVYGILKFIKFGDGAVIMVGAYMAYLSTQFLRLRMALWPSFLISIAIAIGGSALLGILIEKVAFKPTRGKSRLTTFMSSVGVSLFLTYGMEFLVGPQARVVPGILPKVRFEFAGAIITGMQLFILVVTISLLIGVQLLINRTQIGRAIRACSEDMGAAYLTGVNVDRTISFTFALGSGLAAIAGTLISIYYGGIYPTMGWMAGIKGFVCAVVGGIGSVPGAMLGGLLLGMGENLGAAFLASGYRDAIAFIILIIVMLIRPTGIFARVQRSSL